jgi:hypothetical protein
VIEMIKSLLALDENLASSIALRYASKMGELLPLQLQASHVEIPDEKLQPAGGEGWVRRTWEKGLQDAGLLAIQRLLNTEKVFCPFIGAPKVFVGDRDSTLLEELRTGNYDLFIEGNLNTSNIHDFYKLISSRLYAKAPCPIMVVKNLVTNNHVALLCGDGVDHLTFIPQTLRILSSDDIDFSLLYYRFQENEKPVFMDKHEAGSTLLEAEAILQENQKRPLSSEVISGTPEQVASLLRKYSVVASSFPTRKGPRLELLAQCPSPVLLCKTK